MNVIIERCLVVPRGLMKEYGIGGTALHLSRRMLSNMRLTGVDVINRGDMVKVPVTKERFLQHTYDDLDKSSRMMVDYALTFQDDPDQLGLLLFVYKDIKFLMYV